MAKMAMQGPATLAERKAAPPRHLGMLGPYGDLTLYGTLLMEDEAHGEPTADNEFECPTDWRYSGYVPANTVELKALMDKKPEMLLEMVQDKLMTKYRAQSWAVARGGNVTADIELIVNGVAVPGGRVALNVLEAMRASGMVVNVVPRVKKASK